MNPSYVVFKPLYHGDPADKTLLNLIDTAHGFSVYEALELVALGPDKPVLPHEYAIAIQKGPHGNVALAIVEEALKDETIKRYQIFPPLPE